MIKYLLRFSDRACNRAVRMSQLRFNFAANLSLVFNCRINLAEL